MKDFFQKNRWPIFLAILIGLPLFIQTNFMYIGSWLKNFIQIGSPETWLGFWGTYIGSILTVIFTHIDTTMQINKSKELEHSQMEAIDLRSLMAIIIQRKNEYIDYMNLANAIVDAINKKDVKSYMSLLEKATNKEEPKLLSCNLNEQEIIHTNEWNKHFVIFDDNDANIKCIANEWGEIGDLLQEYQENVSESILDARKSMESMEFIESTEFMESMEFMQSTEFMESMESYEKFFKKSANLFNDMATICNKIYNQLHKIFKNKVK